MRNSQKVIGALEFFLERGFCLHGTKYEGPVLEPRQAHCKSGRPEGCLNAVYATSLIVEVPLIMAMERGEGSFYYHHWTGKPVEAGGSEGKTFMPGFVYVLPSDTFKWVESDLVSFVPVRPVARIRVVPSDFRPCIERGTLDLKIPIPAPW